MIVTLNGQEHDLATIKSNAEECLDLFQESAIEFAFTRMGPDYMASSMRGMMHTIIGLADELERVTDQYLDANESA